MSDDTTDAETPPEWKLSFAISMVGNVLRSVLGDLPSDPRVRDVVLNLSEAIHHLAVAHLRRLRGERGWEEEAREAWRTAASVEHQVVLHHDTPLFEALGSIELSVESVADALLTYGPGVEQEEKRRDAVRLAELAIEKVEGTGDPYPNCVARGARLLAEGPGRSAPSAARRDTCGQKAPWSALRSR